ESQQLLLTLWHHPPLSSENTKTFIRSCQRLRKPNPGTCRWSTTKAATSGSCQSPASWLVTETNLWSRCSFPRQHNRVEPVVQEGSDSPGDLAGARRLPNEGVCSRGIASRYQAWIDHSPKYYDRNMRVLPVLTKRGDRLNQIRAHRIITHQDDAG